MLCSVRKQGGENQGGKDWFKERNKKEDNKGNYRRRDGSQYTREAARKIELGWLGAWSRNACALVTYL